MLRKSKLSSVRSIFIALSIVGAAILTISFSTVLAPPACADSWAMPTRETFASESGEYRFTVEPAPIGSPLEYFQDKLDDERSGPSTERPQAIGMLERRRADGRWELIWRQPLVNAVAPVSALVSDDGSRVVTFDNWHSVGHGDDAIAIYGKDGQAVRTLAVSDLVGERYFEAFPRTTSSLRWKKSQRISSDGGCLQLQLVVPSMDRDSDRSILREISLADGSVIAPDQAAWAEALASVEEVLAARADAEQSRLAYLTEPLSAPAGEGMREWHGYLREAFLRLTPDYLNDPSTSTTVLFAPDHARFEESVGWLSDEFADATDDATDWEENISVASPNSQAGLIAALERATAQVRPGSIEGATVYVSVDAGHRPQAEALVARTGARFVWLDPGSEIPQRPERVPGSAAKVAADAEHMQRRQAEMAEMLDDL